MIFAVIDTNVLVAAALTRNPESPTVKVVSSLLSNKLVMLYDEDILLEYKMVLSRSKFNISEDEINHLIDFIRCKGVRSERFEYKNSMPDESDRVFYEISLSRENSFLVTGNLKRFPKEPRVVTPAEIVEILGV